MACKFNNASQILDVEMMLNFQVISKIQFQIPTAIILEIGIDEMSHIAYCRVVEINVNF